MMLKKGFCVWIIIFLTSAVSFASEEKAPKGIMNESKQLLEPLKTYPYKIVYETYQNNNWELFTINADGSNRINLTKTSKIHEMYPHVSPDGTKVCFVSDEKKEGGGKIRCVYYMNVDGSGRTKVVAGARQPCWGPDSQSIAYLKSKYDQFQINDYATEGIVFYDLKTKKHKVHPNKDIHHLYNICWSKNGKWIVATVHAGMGYSHTNLAIEVNGNNVYNLGIGGCRPDLSPDGTKIAWGKTDNIISVADIDLESDVPKVSNSEDLIIDDLHVYHVDWSPDGKYLSYSRGPGGKTPANGPGTNRGIAELVGVRGKWDVCVAPINTQGEFVDLTPNGGSCKETDWFIPAK